MGFGLSGGSSNAGLMFLATKPADERRGRGHTAADIVADLSPKLQSLMFAPNGGLVALFQPPAVQGVGSFGGFQFMLLDSGKNTLGDLDTIAHKIVGASRASKDLTGLLTQFSANDPQVLVTIDRQKAKALNIPLSQITTTLSVFMGSEYINDFDYNSRTYRVFVQADQPFRMTAKDLHNFYVRSDSGQMVPLDNLTTVTESSGPPVISHYNLFRSVEIDGSAAPGYSSGQGIAAMERLATENMMPGMSFQWTGLTLDELESSGKALIIFGLGLLVVYLTLSAQYESFALPFIILLAVPMAVLGALGFMSLRGLANDVYCQIGLVMLIGLSAKNAILIVEFAEQLRKKGRSIAEAAIEAGELRLRPILMTSFAFILGVLPLVFATGAGALGRRSVGTTIVGGMLLSTVLNLIFIPVLYVILSRLLRRGDKPKPNSLRPLPDRIDSLLVVVGDHKVLDAVIDRAADHALFKQVLLGAVGPVAHNALGPATRQARHLEQLIHAGAVDVDALLGRRSGSSRLGHTRVAVILMRRIDAGTNAQQRGQQRESEQRKHGSILRQTRC